MTLDPVSMTISESVKEVRKRIANAAKRAGRNPADVVLVAVTKGVETERIKEAIASGVRILGESRVQEARPKMDALGKEASWHFIGHLQRNKVKYIVGEVDLIHSVDSIELSEEISDRAQKKGVIQNILLEVNISGEKGKFGIPPEEVIPMTKEIARLRNTSLKGMMTVPPFSENPEDSRPHFRRLRELRDEIIGLGIPPSDFKELSMGMSGDFEIGIEEGATLVRIGTAIFGKRG